MRWDVEELQPPPILLLPPLPSAFSPFADWVRPVGVRGLLVGGACRNERVYCRANAALHVHEQRDGAFSSAGAALLVQDDCSRCATGRLLAAPGTPTGASGCLLVA